MKLSHEKKKRWGLALIAIALGIEALYHLGIHPLTVRQQGLQEEITKLDAETESLMKMKKKLLQDAQRAKSGRSRLNEIEAQMPDDVPETWTFRQVSKIMQKHSVEVSSTHVLFIPELSAILLPGSQYEMYYYTCEIKAELFSLGKVLMDLENTFPSATVEGLTIKAGEGGAPHIHQVQLKTGFLMRRGNK